ncbi:MAG TPA: hypothetical protein VGX28_06620, partial [Frankiaceae bacterium]|nr:hypothetical protein [Frankiaceae bacterium]
RPAAVAPARAVARPRPVARRDVVRVGSGERGVAVVARPRTDDDSVLCVHAELPVLGEACVG